MDGSTLLGQVAEAYANLKSLSADILAITESGDEASSRRSEQRTKAYFVAPNKIRIEHSGSLEVFVSDGLVLQTYFAPVKRYSRSDVQQPRLLPGFFRAEHPLVGGPPEFLFHYINERVASAEVLPDPEAGIQAVSVVYEPSPFPSLVSGSPVTYWVDSHTHLILRAESKISHRRPASDEIRTHNKILLFTDFVPDAAIRPETFKYDPPPDAVSGRGGVAGSSGWVETRTVQSGQKKGNWIESRSSHEWDGETLVERYNLRIHGMDLTFERRITFSNDRTQLDVAERIVGPNGETQGNFSLRVG